MRERVTLWSHVLPVFSLGNNLMFNTLRHLQKSIKKHSVIKLVSPNLFTHQYIILLNSYDWLWRTEMVNERGVLWENIHIISIRIGIKVVNSDEYKESWPDCRDWRSFHLKLRTEIQWFELDRLMDMWSVNVNIYVSGMKNLDAGGGNSLDHGFHWRLCEFWFCSEENWTLRLKPFLFFLPAYKKIPWQFVDMHIWKFFPFVFIFKVKLQSVNIIKFLYF